MSRHGTIDSRPPVYDEHLPDFDDDWVPRFTLTERFAHWWTVLMVAVALLTGLGLGDDGESGSMLTLHIAAVVSIGLGLAVALILGNHRALLRSAGRLFSIDRHDVAWLRFRLRHPFARGTHHEWGMFNPGQKLLAWALSTAIALVIITGIQAWSAGGDDSGGPHGAMVVVAMSLLGAHIFMALVNPATRPALTGMVLGRVRRSWAARHHAAWLDDLDR